MNYEQNKIKQYLTKMLINKKININKIYSIKQINIYIIPFYNYN